MARRSGKKDPPHPQKTELTTTVQPKRILILVTDGTDVAEMAIIEACFSRFMCLIVIAKVEPDDDGDKTTTTTTTTVATRDAGEANNNHYNGNTNFESEQEKDASAETEHQKKKKKKKKKSSKSNDDGVTTEAATENPLLCVMSSGSRLLATVLFKEAVLMDWDAVVIPGGLAGCQRMARCQVLQRFLGQQGETRRWWLGACGHAPAIVLPSTLLKPDGHYTCFPKREYLHKLYHNKNSTNGNNKRKKKQQQQPQRVDDEVAVTDNIVTGQGGASTFVFAIRLAQLVHEDPVRAEFVARLLLVDRHSSPTYRDNHQQQQQQEQQEQQEQHEPPRKRRKGAQPTKKKKAAVGRPSSTQEPQEQSGEPPLTPRKQSRSNAKSKNDADSPQPRQTQPQDERTSIGPAMADPAQSPPPSRRYGTRQSSPSTSIRYSESTLDDEEDENSDDDDADYDDADHDDSESGNKKKKRRSTSRSATRRVDESLSMAELDMDTRSNDLGVVQSQTQRSGSRAASQRPRETVSVVELNDDSPLENARSKPKPKPKPKKRSRRRAATKRSKEPLSAVGFDLEATTEADGDAGDKTNKKSSSHSVSQRSKESRSAAELDHQIVNKNTHDEANKRSSSRSASQRSQDSPSAAELDPMEVDTKNDNNDTIAVVRKQKERSNNEAARQMKLSVIVVGGISWKVDNSDSEDGNKTTTRSSSSSAPQPSKDSISTAELHSETPTMEAGSDVGDKTKERSSSRSAPQRSKESLSLAKSNLVEVDTNHDSKNVGVGAPVREQKQRSSNGAAPQESVSVVQLDDETLSEVDNNCREGANQKTKRSNSHPATQRSKETRSATELDNETAMEAESGTANGRKKRSRSRSAARRPKKSLPVARLHPIEVDANHGSNDAGVGVRKQKQRSGSGAAAQRMKESAFLKQLDDDEARSADDTNDKEHGKNTTKRSSSHPVTQRSEESIPAAELDHETTMEADAQTKTSSSSRPVTQRSRKSTSAAELDRDTTIVADSESGNKTKKRSRGRSATQRSKKSTSGAELSPMGVNTHGNNNVGISVGKQNQRSTNDAADQLVMESVPVVELDHETTVEADAQTKMNSSSCPVTQRSRKSTSAAELDHETTIVADSQPGNRTKKRSRGRSATQRSKKLASAAEFGPVEVKAKLGSNDASAGVRKQKQRSGSGAATKQMKESVSVVHLDDEDESSSEVDINEREDGKKTTKRSSSRPATERFNSSNDVGVRGQKQRSRNDAAAQLVRESMSVVELDYEASSEVDTNHKEDGKNTTKGPGSRHASERFEESLSVLKLNNETPMMDAETSHSDSGNKTAKRPSSCSATQSTQESRSVFDLNSETPMGEAETNHSDASACSAIQRSKESLSVSELDRETSIAVDANNSNDGDARSKQTERTTSMPILACIDKANAGPKQKRKSDSNSGNQQINKSQSVGELDYETPTAVDTNHSKDGGGRTKPTREKMSGIPIQIAVDTKLNNDASNDGNRTKQSFSRPTKVQNKKSVSMAELHHETPPDGDTNHSNDGYVAELKRQQPKTSIPIEVDTNLGKDDGDANKTSSRAGEAKPDDRQISVFLDHAKSPEPQVEGITAVQVLAHVPEAPSTNTSRYPTRGRKLQLRRSHDAAGNGNNIGESHYMQNPKWSSEASSVPHPRPNEGAIRVNPHGWSNLWQHLRDISWRDGAGIQANDRVYFPPGVSRSRRSHDIFESPTSVVESILNNQNYYGQHTVSLAQKCLDRPTRQGQQQWHHHKKAQPSTTNHSSKVENLTRLSSRVHSMEVFEL